MAPGKRTQDPRPVRLQARKKTRAALESARTAFTGSRMPTPLIPFPALSVQPPGEGCGQGAAIFVSISEFSVFFHNQNGWSVATWAVWTCTRSDRNGWGSSMVETGEPDSDCSSPRPSSLAGHPPESVAFLKLGQGIPQNPLPRRHPGGPFVEQEF